MKKNITTIIILLVALVGQASAQTADTITVRIKGMKCDECAHKVMTKVMENKGVNDIWFNIERRTATVSYDPAVTSPDEILTPLRGTRYNPTDYSPADTILRGFGLRMPEMQVDIDVLRATTALQGQEGVDSLAPHLDKHYLFVRYDANRTSRAEIKRLLLEAGFTPTNYYTGPKVAYAVYQLATGSGLVALDKVLAVKGVEDAVYNNQKDRLAITYFTDETQTDKLQADLQTIGVKVAL